MDTQWTVAEREAGRMDPARWTMEQVAERVREKLAEDARRAAHIPGRLWVPQWKLVRWPKPRLAGPVPW